MFGVAGVLGVAGIVGLAVARAGRGQLYAMISADPAMGQNSYSCMFKYDPWATQVELRLIGPVDVEEAVDLAAVMQRNRTVSAKDWYGDTPPPEGPWLGEGLSESPRASVLSAEGVWCETVYGWPLRCLRVRGWAFSASAGSRGQFWPARRVAGRFGWSLAPRETAVCFGAVAGPVLVALLVAVPWWRWRRVKRRLARGLCPRCAYPAKGECPECGWRGEVEVGAG